MAARLTVILLALSLLSPSGQGRAAAFGLRELQAAYFYKFLMFTQWPESTDHPRTLVVKVLQDDAVSAAMRAAPDRVIHDRTLMVVDCRTPAELEGADAIFIPDDTAAQLPDSAWKNFGASTLVVSDWPQALEHGATIQLNSIDGKIRFAVSLDREKKLVISSKLLHLATEIRK